MPTPVRVFDALLLFSWADCLVPLLPTNTQHGHRSAKRFDWEKFKRIASPSTHDVLRDEAMAIDTKRHYSYRTQRWRLIRLSVGEFVVTVILCLAIFGALLGYSRWATLNPKQKRVSDLCLLNAGKLIGLGL